MSPEHQLNKTTHKRKKTFQHLGQRRGLLNVLSGWSQVKLWPANTQLIVLLPTRGLDLACIELQWSWQRTAERKAQIVLKSPYHYIPLSISCASSGSTLWAPSFKDPCFAHYYWWGAKRRTKWTHQIAENMITILRKSWTISKKKGPPRLKTKQ